MLPGAAGSLSQVGGAAGSQRPHRQGAPPGYRLLLGLKADDHQGAAASLAEAEVAVEEPTDGSARPREGQRALRLLLVGDANDLRQARALGQRADDLAP